MSIKYRTGANGVLAALKLTGAAALALPFIMMLALAGCPTEDDGGGGIPAELIGKWEGTTAGSGATGTAGKYLEFTSDNKLNIWTSGFTGDPQLTFTVTSVSGGKVSIQSSGANTSDGSFKYTLNSAKTEMTVSDQEMNGNSAGYAVYTKQTESPSGGLTVTAAGGVSTVAKGGTLQFSVSPAQTVTWSITTSGKHSGTAINAAGLLTVAAAETQPSLEIKAVSTADPSKSGTATVTVTGGSSGGGAFADLVGKWEGTGSGTQGKYLEFTADNKLLIRQSATGSAVTYTVTAVSGGKVEIMSSGATISDGSFKYTLNEAKTEMTVSEKVGNGNSAGYAAYTKQTESQTPVITSVTVSPETAAVETGGTLQFTAVVSGDPAPTQTVTWSITTSGTALGTSISTSGLLTVAAGETKTSLEIKAVSTVDAAKSGTATVAVSKAPTGYTVTTIAGNTSGSTGGFADGAGTTAAKFNRPAGVAVDSDGNLYVADTLNHRIRKITPAGEVTTVAGNGTSGSDNGTPGRFNEPHSVDVHSNGNLYVTDKNHKIRRVLSTGMVQTVSLSGVLSYPRGIKIDSEGNLYVADSGNNRICKIDLLNFMTGVPGADLSSPSGVALDSAGTIYVADSSRHRIQKVMAGVLAEIIAGDGTSGFADGTGTAARFNYPSDIVADSVGNLYVADTYNNCIRKITPAGVVSTIAGDSTQGANDGTGTAAQFNWPTGLAIDSAGAIYVADTRNHRIRKITPVYE